MVFPCVLLQSRLSALRCNEQLSIASSLLAGMTSSRGMALSRPSPLQTCASWNGICKMAFSAAVMHCLVPLAFQPGIASRRNVVHGKKEPSAWVLKDGGLATEEKSVVGADWMQSRFISPSSERLVWLFVAFGTTTTFKHVWRTGACHCGTFLVTSTGDGAPWLQ